MQQPLFIKKRYRVTQTLAAQEDYAAFLAVDVEDRDNRRVLINVYEGESRKHYVQQLSSVTNVPEFGGITMDGRSLCAFFTHFDGPGINDVFYRGAKHDWQTRLFYAGELFHLALRLSQTVPEIGCAAFRSENLIVKTEEERLVVNCVLRPVPYASQREMVFLLIDQVLKVLLTRWDSAPKEVEFTTVLAASEFSSIPALYSYWLEYERAIRAQYTAIDKKSSFHKFFYRLFQNIGRMFSRKMR